MFNYRLIRLMGGRVRQVEFIREKRKNPWNDRRLQQMLPPGHAPARFCKAGRRGRPEAEVEDGM
jgi:hypothetical protein